MKDGACSAEDYRQKLWSFIVKKEIPKMAKLFSTSRHNTLVANKKVSNIIYIQYCYCSLKCVSRLLSCVRGK